MNESENVFDQIDNKDYPDYFGSPRLEEESPSEELEEGEEETGGTSEETTD